MYLLSAFSINMLDLTEYDHAVKFNTMTEEEVIKTLDDNAFESYIAHESTAIVLSARLGVEIDYNRNNILLGDGDYAIVCQLPRQKEGQLYTQEEIAEMNIAYIFIEIDKNYGEIEQ